MARPYPKQIALGLVVLAITYLSLVIGELVPKRIGLGNSEGIALGMATFMHRLSLLAAPLITFLSRSTGHSSTPSRGLTLDRPGLDRVGGLVCDGQRLGTAGFPLVSQLHRKRARTFDSQAFRGIRHCSPYWHPGS